MIPRRLDHLVLPVSSVERARARYEALGFTVAPDGEHPFGTVNCCVFLANGVFLEPLAVAKREVCEAAIAAGNTFLRNDAAYRFRLDIEGFSHLVVGSNDADADHAAFEDTAMSDGPMVRFERRFATAGGEGEAAFATAFAGDRRAPDAGFFACEVVRSPDVDRSALLQHPNGATAITETIMSEPNPSDFQYFLQSLLAQREMDNHSFGIEFALANAKVSVLTPAGMRAFCGFDAPTSRGLLHQTFVVAVPRLDALRERLSERDIPAATVGRRLLVPWAPGQGANILFEEAA